LVKLGKQASEQAALDDSRVKFVGIVMPGDEPKTSDGGQFGIPLQVGYDGDGFEVGTLG
jgi:hypothetical protein